MKIETQPCCVSLSLDRGGNWIRRLDGYHGERKDDLDLEAAGAEIPGAYLPIMELDRALGDRQSQANSAGAAFPRGVYAIKRFEHVVELRIGNPRSLILHHDANLVVVTGGAD